MPAAEAAPSIERHLPFTSRKRCFRASAQEMKQLQVAFGHFPQQCLYFFPLLQGQGSFRPTFGPARTGFAFSTAAAASLTMSLPCGGPFRGAGEELGSAAVVLPPNALLD